MGTSTSPPVLRKARCRTVCCSVQTVQPGIRSRGELHTPPQTQDKHGDPHARPFSMTHGRGSVRNPSRRHGARKIPGHSHTRFVTPAPSPMIAAPPCGERCTQKHPEKHVSPGQNDSAWGKPVGRVGLEPIRVTALTCGDAETTDIATRFYPGASPSIRLERGSVRRSPHRPPRSSDTPLPLRHLRTTTQATPPKSCVCTPEHALTPAARCHPTRSHSVAQPPPQDPLLCTIIGLVCCARNPEGYFCSVFWSVVATLVR